VCRLLRSEGIWGRWASTPRGRFLPTLRRGETRRHRPTDARVLPSWVVPAAATARFGSHALLPGHALGAALARPLRRAGRGGRLPTLRASRCSPAPVEPGFLFLSVSGASSVVGCPDQTLPVWECPRFSCGQFNVD
jgi:hypothetical protein